MKTVFFILGVIVLVASPYLLFYIFRNQIDWVYKLLTNPIEDHTKTLFLGKTDHEIAIDLAIIARKRKQKIQEFREVVEAKKSYLKTYNQAAIFTFVCVLIVVLVWIIYQVYYDIEINISVLSIICPLPFLFVAAIFGNKWTKFWLKRTNQELSIFKTAILLSELKDEDFENELNA